MSLTPPTTAVFVISLILAALAVIGKFVVIPVFTDHGFWVAIIAYVILAIGNLFRGVSFTRDPEGLGPCVAP